MHEIMDNITNYLQSIRYNTSYNIEAVFIGLLIILLAICIVTDFKYRKIPRVISYLIICFGILYSIVMGSFKSGLINFAIVIFTMALIMLFIDVIGGGDVRLIAGLAFWFSLNDVAWILIITGAVGVVVIGVWEYLKYKKSESIEEVIIGLSALLNFGLRECGRYIKSVSDSKAREIEQNPDVKFQPKIIPYGGLISFVTICYIVVGKILGYWGI